ncbi:hypothetical protein IP84_14415 [beta proteobacterium AAP99]|nr:hypothetical protein IP84_14415 [beta proteobacterium AAP99]
MKHAGAEALAALAPLLAQLRNLPGLTERKPGIFYRGGGAFMHFHEDPSGLFADLKQRGTFVRWPVASAAHRKALLAAARAECASPRTPKAGVTA